MLVKIKVLIVDNSQAVRSHLTKGLSADPDIDIIGTASDPYTARDAIIKLNPSLVILNINDINMDGITFLEKIMKYNPLPVIIISSIDQERCIFTIKAIEHGAVDIINKTNEELIQNNILIEQLIDKIKISYLASVKNHSVTFKLFKNHLSSNRTLKIRNLNRILFISVSIEGIEGIKEVIYRLPINTPGVFVIIDLPVDCLKIYADKINADCHLNIKAYQDGDEIESGKVLFVSADQYINIQKRDNKYYIHSIPLSDDNKINSSHNILFKSASQVIGSDLIAVILTGTRNENIEDMQNMKNAGAIIITTDEQTSVLYNTQKILIQKGLIDHILPIDRIADQIIDLLMIKS